MKRFTAVLITILFVFPTVFYAEEFTAIENKFRAKVIAKAKKLGAIYKKKIIEAKKANDDELADQLSQALGQHKEKTKKLLESMVFTPTKQQIEKEIIRLAKINLKPVEDVGPFETILFPDKKFANIIRQLINKDADEEIFLSDLRNITYLSSLHTKCDIAGIQYLTNLQTLHISSATTFDPKEINSLQRLYTLHLSTTNTENSKKVALISNIKSLRIYAKSFTNLKGIIANKSLTSLHLAGCNVKSLNALANHPSLERLIVYDLDIGDYSFLTTIPKLTQLNISNQYNTSIIPLDKLIKLRYLRLFNVRIPNLNFLKKLTSLTSLSISQRNTDNTIDIAKLPANVLLTSLSLDYSNLKNLEQIQNKFPSLKSLSVDSCKLRNLNFLKPSTTLEYFSGTSNYISDLKPLGLCPNLVTLNLYNNKITTLQDIKKLRKITHLNLNSNRLKNLTDLLGIFLVLGERRYGSVYIDNNRLDITKNSKNKAIINQLDDARITVTYKNGNKL